MKQEKNAVLNRLVDFAESKGGFAEIGRTISKHPSMFYNLVRRDAMPSLATLTEIANAYPDLDLNYIIRGKPSIEGERLVRLEQELDRERSMVNRLLGKAKGTIFRPEVAKDLMVKRHRIDSARMAISNAHKPAKKVVASDRVPQVGMLILTAGYGSGFSQN